MLVPARFNVLLDRFGRPVEPVKTVKMGWRKGFRKLRGQYPDGTWPFGVRWASRARYNRFLQRIRRLIKKLGIWRSILSELCGDLLGSYFAERVRDCSPNAHSLTRSHRPSQTYNFCLPTNAAGVWQQIVDRLGDRLPRHVQGEAFEIDVNDRLDLQGLIRAIFQVATDVIRERNPRGRRRRQFDLLQRLRQPDGDRVNQVRARRLETAQLALRGNPRGPPLRVPGTLLSDFCNELAQMCAVELENMAQRGFYTVCYAEKYFEAMTGGDTAKAKLMGRAFLSKYRLPVIQEGFDSVRADKCTWYQRDIDIVASENRKFRQRVQLSAALREGIDPDGIERIINDDGEGPRQGAGRDAVVYDIDDEIENVAQEEREELGEGDGEEREELGEGDGVEQEEREELGEGDGERQAVGGGGARRRRRRHPTLPRITRTSVKANTGVCLTMMRRWLSVIEESNDTADERGVKPTQVFDLAPHAALGKIKSMWVTKTMWDGSGQAPRVGGILGWALGRDRAARNMVGQIQVPFDGNDRWYMREFFTSNGVFMRFVFDFVRTSALSSTSLTSLLAALAPQPPVHEKRPRRRSGRRTGQGCVLHDSPDEAVDAHQQSVRHQGAAPALQGAIRDRQAGGLWLRRGGLQLVDGHGGSPTP